MPILKTHSFYQISQGNISIWSTPWCSNWVDIYDNLIIQPNSYNYPSQVKDLWLPNEKKWNHELIDNLFQSQMATSIKNTPIICSQEEDFLCWKLTPAGKCNSKSAYSACLQNLQEQGEPKPRQINSDTKMLLRQI
jgi:hypothetical protein